MMRMLKDWGLALVVGFAVFMLGDLLSRQATDHGPAPGFELENVAGGTATLSGLAGQPVILNFWGTWCPPCVKEIPEFARWHAKHPEVAILGLAVNSGDATKVRADAARLGITWPVALADDDVLADYGVSVYPTTVVVGADGQIRATVQGELSEAALDRLVASALP